MQGSDPIPPQNNFGQGKKSAKNRRRKLYYRPTLEALEDRITPYVLSGYSFASANISASFVPDGTWDYGYQSDLFALYNASYPTATWQLQFAKALQTWANSSALNFHFVSDDGSPSGTSGLAQGDPRFGDIRLDANTGLPTLGGAWFPAANTTLGGDVTINGTTAAGTLSELYSILLHELGGALGLGEGSLAPSVMNGSGPFSGLYADDIAGIQALYGTRPSDTASHNLASPTPLTLSSGGVTLNNANITSVGAVDYYKVTAPASSDGTLTVSVDARNLSLFQPKVAVFDAAGHLLATANASIYGSVATVNLTGLVAGQSYVLEAAGATTDVFGMGAYKLTAQFGSGASVSSIKAPSGLTASAVSAQVNLVWTGNDAKATGYVIDRSTDGVNWSQVANLPAGGTSYADSAVSAGLTYDYQVYAVIGTTLSNSSNMAGATLIPLAPAALTAAGVSTSQINLSWSAVTGAMGFAIERSPDGVTWAQIATTAAGVTSYQDAGLGAGSTYLYEVCANNAGGNSAFSNQARATTLAAAPPLSAAPGLAAWAASSTQVNLSWIDSIGNATGYVVDRSLDGVNWTKLANLGASTSYADTLVSAGLTYDYRVSAVRGTLFSSPSAPASVTLAPLAPAALTATRASPSQINLVWSNVTGETGFTIERSADGINWIQIAVTAPNITSYQDIGLNAGTTYHYHVSATNAGGNSPTRTASATTVLAAPTGLIATAVSPGQVNLVWSDIPGEIGFVIEHSPNGVNTWTQFAATAPGVNNYSNTGLYAGHTCYYRVRAKYTAGVSAASTKAWATTPLVPPPTGLTAGTVSTSQINLAWSDVPGETGFRIERSPNGVDTWTQIATTATGVTWFQNTGLYSGRTYYYRVRACTAAGVSAPSTRASARTVPLAPLGLSAKTVSSSQINLTWSDVTGETGFQIERSLDGLHWTALASTAANVTSFKDTGLLSATTYYYRVRATNPGGTSAPSAVASAVPRYIPIIPQSQAFLYFF